MPGPSADRNLLFGILALQMDLITREALIAAMGAWALAKHRPIGEILVEAGALDPVDRLALEPMVDRKVAREGGDPARSLASLSTASGLADDLRRSIADAESRASASPETRGEVADPFATRAPSSPDPGTFEGPTPAANPPAVARYRKVRDHAQGGLGVVFVALDAELNREVALKEIRERHADDPASQARFLLEAEITGGLEHPGIVPVYGLGHHDDGRPFYAMRLIRGDSLKAAIAGFHADEALKADPGARSLELQKLLRRYLDVCNAVAYAHSRGVLHRDLKPDNVMVGQYGETLVVDWGLAKTVDRPDGPWPEPALSPSATSGGSAETLPGSVVGTPAYMSPEQAEGRIDDLGPASDVYSLGATLYALLAGVAPFGGKPLPEIVADVRMGRFAGPREVVRWLDPGLEAVCLKAMALRPADRHPTPRALAEDVQRWLADEPVSAYREGVRQRLARWSRRNRAWVQAGAASLALMAVLAVAFAFQQSRAADRLRTEQEKTKEALISETEQRGNAVRERRVALQSVSDLFLRRGMTQAGEGDIGEGMLLMATALNNAPTDDLARQHAIRANLAWWGRLARPLAAVLDVTGEAYSVAFSPDGRAVLTTGRDGAARLWSSLDGSPIGPPLKHPGAVEVAAFSPDGKLVATGGADSTARLWSATDGSPVGRPMPHGGPIKAVAFRPDGQVVATASLDKTARLWSGVDGSPVGSPMPHGGPVNAMAFGADRKVIVTGGDDGSARRWSATDGSPIGPPLPHGDRILGIACSPDGQAIATVGGGKEARLWSIADGSPVGALMRHDDWVGRVAFSPDGSRVLTGSVDATARLWDARDGSPIGRPMLHQARVSALAFSPDGRTILTGGRDNVARLWSASDGSPLGRRWRHPGRINGVAFHPDGRSFVVGFEGGARLWGPEAGRDLRRLSLPAKSYRTAFRPDGKVLLTAGENARDDDAHASRLRDAADGSPIGPKLEHSPGHAVIAAAFSPDGQAVVTAGYDKTARLWSALDGSPIGRPMEHSEGINDVAYRPDGTMVATGSADKTARLWSALDGSPLGGPIPHDDEVEAVAFSPDGKRIVTASGNVARPWSVPDGVAVGRPLEHPKLVRAVAFSPDGRTILTGGRDGVVRAWSAEDGKPVGRPMVHPKEINALAFAPDGQTILTGAEDGLARLWGAFAATPIGEPVAYSQMINGVAFSPDGKIAMSASLDGAAWLSPLPVPMAGEPARVATWVETLTGLELRADGDESGFLDGPAWRGRRRILDGKGGPPSL